jgi:group I intron endonuclease
MKKNIINENRFQSGIYCWIKRNTLEDCYVGQSENLSVRLSNYYSKSVLSNKNISLIHRALVKYGHSNFSLIILEYCEISHLDDREQFYLDSLYSSYNILRFAGSFKGYQKSQENILKFKKSMESLMVVYQLNSSNMYEVG